MKSKSYFEWLCNFIGNSDKYLNLLEQLHSIEFYSLVPNDQNRAADGLELRSVYLYEEGRHDLSSLPEMPCTVLEMMIGLAKRLEFDLAGGKYERSAGAWFWVLIDNLGLSWYDEVWYEDIEINSSDVDFIIKRLLERQYLPNGDGGLFPLKVSQNDQRRIELWYQMTAWENENYPI